MIEAERRTEKITLLKQAYPSIFSTTNLIREAINGSGQLTLTNELESIDGDNCQGIEPFTNFKINYDEGTIQTDDIFIKRWKLKIGFVTNKQGLEEKSKLGLIYLGVKNSDDSQALPSSKLYIYFNLPSRGILIDLEKEMIGVRGKDNQPPGYDVSLFSGQAKMDNPEVISKILEEMSESSSLKIYDFEIDREQNIIAFRCKGGIFGNKETHIVLPLQMKIDLNTIKTGFLSTGEYNKGRPVVKKGREPKEYNSRVKTIPINVLGIEAEAIIIGKNIKIRIDYFIFTLNQLIALHHIRELRYQNKDFYQNTGIKTSAQNLLRQLLFSNDWVFIGGTQLPLNKIEELARKLGILNQPFIDALKKQLKTIRLKSETE